MISIDNCDFKGKRAIIRVDFNVPLNEKGEVTDDTRIRAAMPTVKKVLAGGGSVILMSHMGRPKKNPDPKYSLEQIAPAVEKNLGVKVEFAGDCMGEKAAEMAKALKPGQVMLLENLRYEDLMRWKLGNLLEKEWTGIYIPEKEKAYDLNGDGINDVCVTDGKPGTEKGVFYIDLSKGQYTLDKNNCLIYNETRMWADRKYLHPIPKTACVISPALGQNDGWEE